MTYKEYRKLIDTGEIVPVLTSYNTEKEFMGGIYRSKDGKSAFFIVYDNINFSITLYEITKNSITVYDLMESKRYNFINLN